jgi:hypothetical protein
VGFTQSKDVDVWIVQDSDSHRFELHAQHCEGGDRFRFESDGAGVIERVARADRRC